MICQGCLSDDCTNCVHKDKAEALGVFRDASASEAPESCAIDQLFELLMEIVDLKVEDAVSKANHDSSDTWYTFNPSRVEEKKEQAKGLITTLLEGAQGG